MIYEDIAPVPFGKAPLFLHFIGKTATDFSESRVQHFAHARLFSVPILILQNKAFPLGCFTYSLLKWTLWCVKYAVCIRPIPQTAALKHSSYSLSTVTSGFYNETFPVSRHKRLSYVHKTKPCQILTIVKCALLNTFSPKFFVLFSQWLKRTLNLGGLVIIILIGDITKL